MGQHAKVASLNPIDEVEARSNRSARVADQIVNDYVVARPRTCMADLPQYLRQDVVFRAGDVEESLRESSFEAKLQDYKIKLAHEAVQECNGNKTLAARSLQISRTYLHRLIKEPGEGDD